MLTKILYFDCAMLILDLITISSLRKFLLDFLRVSKSKKNAKLIYTMQPLKNKIMLSFIGEHLKKYTKEFFRFHKLYRVVLYTLLPQYVIVIACNILLKMKSVYVLCLFAAIKLFICFFIRINVDSNRVSVYRKK